MKKNNVKIDVEVDTTELKDAITLIRRLKHEVVELKKQGLSRRVINKIILKNIKKNSKKYQR